MNRRAWPRRSRPDGAWIACARLIPGRSVDVIDLSRGGALIETDYRLLPGAPVELQLAGPITFERVRGHVVRSQVAVLDRERGIRYRGALIFEKQLPLESEEPLTGG